MPTFAVALLADSIAEEVLSIRFIDAETGLEAACKRISTPEWPVDPEHYTSLEEFEEQMNDMDILVKAREIQLTNEESTGIRLPLGQMRVVTDAETEQ